MLVVLTILVYILVVAFVALLKEGVARRAVGELESRVEKIERDQEAWKQAVRSVVDRHRGVETQGRGPRFVEEEQPPGSP